MFSALKSFFLSQSEAPVVIKKFLKMVSMKYIYGISPPS
jgi:nucleoside permease NupC